jgi:hypothetical protein
MAPLRVSRPRFREKIEAITFNTTIEGQKDNNHFNFFSSPRPKPMIGCDLEDQAHHQPQSQPQGFAQV